MEFTVNSERRLAHSWLPAFSTLVFNGTSKLWQKPILVSLASMIFPWRPFCFSAALLGLFRLDTGDLDELRDPLEIAAEVAPERFRAFAA